MADGVLILLIIAWLLAVIGGPTVYLARKSYLSTGTPQHYKLSRTLRGWLFGSAASVVPIIVIPYLITFFFFLPDLVTGDISSEDFDETMGHIRLFLVLVMPPLCAALGFLLAIYLVQRNTSHEEGVAPRHEEELSEEEEESTLI